MAEPTGPAHPNHRPYDATTAGVCRLSAHLGQLPRPETNYQQRNNQAQLINTLHAEMLSFLSDERTFIYSHEKCGLVEIPSPEVTFAEGNRRPAGAFFLLKAFLFLPRCG